MIRCVLLLLLFISVNSIAATRGLHYGAVTDPELLKCDALLWQGLRTDARLCYRQLSQRATSAEVRAEIAWALDDVKTANDLFKTATRMDPDDSMIRTRWGELYTQTYQYKEALDLFNEALERDPENGFANIGAASVLAKSFDSEASAYLKSAMDDDDILPGVRLRSMLLLAHMAMEENNRKQAGDILDDAEKLATDNELSLLEVYAHRAALALLSMEDDSQWIEKALQENPKYGDAYAIPAYFLWITHLYREAGTYYEKAIELEPDNWQAHMELGTNHLRFNRVSLARKHLEISYEGDPFNPKAVNTLRLLDTFDRFELVNYPEPEEGRLLPDMTLRLHKEEEHVLAPYTQAMVARGIEEYSQRYNFKLKEPVIVEIYPDHEDFIVRTIGMPGMGLLGVAFGYLLAMDSPSGKAGDDYHWGTTLWHELAHVFTLESTNSRVPRWFSEGVSVYEEWRNGPIPGIRIPVDVYQSMAEDQFLPVAELDRGFIRPTYANQVIVSYMQAGLICDFIHEEFGQEKLVDMLSVFKEGTETAEAIEKVFQMSPSSFDKQFNQYIDDNYSEFLANLDKWREHMQSAAENYSEGDYSSAIINAEMAVKLFPGYVEVDSPYLIMASAHDKNDNKEGQMQNLRTYWELGGYSPGALKALAHYVYDSSDPDDAISIMKSVNYVAPFDAELHDTLGDWLMESGKASEALIEYQVTLALQPHDMAAAHFRVARAHNALDDVDKTRSHLLSALEIAPHYRQAQKLLLEIIQSSRGLSTGDNDP
jgi:tetratricopeptide (TPR) repeat protein